MVISPNLTGQANHAWTFMVWLAIIFVEYVRHAMPYHARLFEGLSKRNSLMVCWNFLTLANGGTVGLDLSPTRRLELFKHVCWWRDSVGAWLICRKSFHCYQFFIGFKTPSKCLEQYFGWSHSSVCSLVATSDKGAQQALNNFFLIEALRKIKWQIIL